jgi:hypothetical protein
MAREAQNARVKELFSRIKLGSGVLVEIDPATAKWKPDEAGQIAYRLLCFVEAARNHPIRYGEAGQEAKNLPQFCDDSADAWWKVARATLLDSYPQPDKAEVLNRLVTDPQRRRSPGRIRQSVLDILKARFLSFARNTAYQT